MKCACALALAGLAAIVSAHAHAEAEFRPAITQPDGFVAPLADTPSNWVGPKKLAAQIKRKELVDGSKALQSFSDRYWQKNRVFGGQAHNDTVNYLLREIEKTGYYNAYLQPNVQLWSDSNVTLTVDGTEYDVQGGTLVPNGDATAPIVAVANQGCNATDFPAGVADSIALIIRGICPFSDKVALAGASGATGAIIYNNVPGALGATLGDVSNPLGPYVPAVFALQTDGEALLASLPGPVARVYVSAAFENRTTYNVVAETKDGDHDNVVALGAHTDSVNAGPGINDNGSGSIGILAVARALAKYKVKNAVRFHWWTAEEFGLLGAQYYVDNLTPEEAAKIRLYLNFDMIASPNYVYSIYDGDGSAFNVTGPPGSAEIEKLFEDFFKRRGDPSVPTAFDGRSDYGPFLDVGIAAGGLFTGAEELKTEEEAAAFGGTAGVALDACYHAACDTISNLNLKAFLRNTKAIAVAIGTYAWDLSTIPVRTTKSKRDMETRIAERAATYVQRRADEYAVRLREGVQSCNHKAEPRVSI